MHLPAYVLLPKQVNLLALAREIFGITDLIRIDLGRLSAGAPRRPLHRRLRQASATFGGTFNRLLACLALVVDTRLTCDHNIR